MSYDSLKSDALAAVAKAAASANTSSVAAQASEAAAAQALTDLTAARSAVMAIQPDPVVPPVVVPPVITPDGYAPMVVDKNLIVWSINPTTGKVAVNGKDNPATANVKRLYADHGVAKFVNADGVWYIPNPLGGPSTQTTDPTAPVVVTPPSGDPPPTQSLLWTGAAGTFPTNVTPETGGGGWGNGELETYTSSTQNAYCDGKGHLIIVAKADKTSARLNTTKSLQIQPGSYFECRAVLPANGWAAIWTIGVDAMPPQNVPWPDNGEIDVVEIDGGHAKTNAHTTNNVQSGWGYPGADTGPVDGKTEVAYGCYFDGTVVKFYRDRKLTSQWTAQQAAAQGAKWPFNQAVYVILNIAIAGGDNNFSGGVGTFGPIYAWKGKLPVLS